jgi:hypothetical protein
MANDVAMAIGVGVAIEKIAISTGVDSGLPVMLIQFSTSAFDTREKFVRALTEILNYSEGVVWPPVNKASAP